METTGRSVKVAVSADGSGIVSQPVRTWIRQAEVDAGKRPGTTTTDARSAAAAISSSRVG